MAMELDLAPLAIPQHELCEKTMSINTFFMLVGDALSQGKGFSVVRMGDGEKQLYLYSRSHAGKIEWPNNSPFGSDWLNSYGCEGIPCSEMEWRIKYAAEKCTYFAPQVMGIQREAWSIAWLTQRRVYVDNWFVSQWSRELQEQLLKQAGEVLFIHGDSRTRVAFARRCQSLGVSIGCLDLVDWRQADTVIALAHDRPSKLVLFAGGPANKYIGPMIAEKGKVVLDLGSAAARCWL